EQSDGIGQVNTAVSQLDQMTQQNAALVEESAAAAQSLKDQATRLADVVQQFRIGHDVAAPLAAPATTATPAPIPARPIRQQPPVKAATPAELRKETPAAIRPPATPAKTDEGDWESF
ncbi:chemotaxis protein, partial [Hydrogenophaga intermedia]|nr:chemotaxis protein [Hydrogenophaga intermedia]